MVWLYSDASPLKRATDPTRWAHFDQLNGHPKGFVLGDGWAGIDLDDCVENGKVGVPTGDR